MRNRFAISFLLAASAAFAQPAAFDARGYTLKLLIQQAYGVKGFRVSGGPGWLDADRYDITAHGAANSTRLQINLGDADPQGIPLVDALKDQLGLKLSARKASAN